MSEINNNKVPYSPLKELSPTSDNINVDKCKKLRDEFAQKIAFLEKEAKKLAFNGKYELAGFYLGQAQVIGYCLDAINKTINEKISKAL